MARRGRRAASTHTSLLKYAKVGVFQALIVMGSLYVSDRTGNPFFGALAIPLTLTAVLALEDSKVDGHAHFLTLTLAVYAAVTALFYLLVARYQVPKGQALTISMALWVLITVLLYLTNGGRAQ